MKTPMTLLTRAALVAAVLGTGVSAGRAGGAPADAPHAPPAGAWSTSRSYSQDGASYSESLSVTDSATGGPEQADVTVQEMAGGVTHTRHRDGVPRSQVDAVLAELIADAKRGLRGPADSRAPGDHADAADGEIALDWSGAGMRELTLTSDAALAFRSASPGAVLRLGLTQDARGGRTVTWPAAVRWPGGTAPRLTAARDRTDWFEFIYDGTHYFGVVLGQGY